MLAGNRATVWNGNPLWHPYSSHSHPPIPPFPPTHAVPTWKVTGAAAAVPCVIPGAITPQQQRPPTGFGATQPGAAALHAPSPGKRACKMAEVGRC